MYDCSEEALRACVKNASIEVPQQLVDEEYDLMVLEFKHQQQYEMLTSGTISFLSPEEMDEKLNVLKQEAYLSVKSDLLIKATIASQNFTITMDELEAEAIAMAKRQNTTLQLIKQFFGEDLAMLQQDLLQQKAREYILNH